MKAELSSNGGHKLRQILNGKLSLVLRVHQFKNKINNYTIN
ncbi:hypothetical protein BSV1_M58 (plasmid) [Borreliella finlandensis]|uniref:Uncharacterized protein n=1 Tax=Borreliella finlandensis TaxID=498741 RepID=A0A826GWZ7_9SPIR|nr:hypothetical protein BSV1_M58 [Borreliella finlandensis]